MNSNPKGHGEFADRAPDNPGVPVCPICGHDEKSFRASGRLGCPIDYDVFASALSSVFAASQAASLHVGKWPNRGPSRFGFLKLKADLRSAVERQDYESAARFRDLIRERTKPRES
jgi:protein arginine kinase activator